MKHKHSKLYTTIDHYLSSFDELVIREKRFLDVLDSKVGLIKTVELEREIIREDYEIAIEELERHLISLCEKPIIVDEDFCEESNELTLRILFDKEFTYYLKGK